MHQDDQFSGFIGERFTLTIRGFRSNSKGGLQIVVFKMAIVVGRMNDPNRRKSWGAVVIAKAFGGHRFRIAFAF